MKTDNRQILIIHPVCTSNEVEDVGDEFSIELSEVASLISVNRLKKQLQEITNELLSLVNDISSSSGNYELNELEINLQITTEGKLGLLGSTIGGDASGGIKLKYKRIRRS